MKRFSTESFVLPAFLASYLINGDDTGLSISEVNSLHDFMSANNLESCLSCGDEPFFSSFHDYRSVVNHGIECLRFDFKLKG
jgi:hypothetical protein